MTFSENVFKIKRFFWDPKNNFNPLKFLIILFRVDLTVKFNLVKPKSKFDQIGNVSNLFLKPPFVNIPKM